MKILYATAGAFMALIATGLQADEKKPSVTSVQTACHGTAVEVRRNTSLGGETRR